MVLLKDGRRALVQPLSLAGVRPGIAAVMCLQQWHSLAQGASLLLIGLGQHLELLFLLLSYTVQF